MPLTRLIQAHPTDAQHRMMRLRAFYAAGVSDAYEHLYAAMKVILGGWLLLPLHTFASAPRAYRLVAAFAPEWTWGLFWCLTGLAQFVAWYYDARPARFWVNGLGAVLWGGYGVLLVLGDPRSPALAFFAPMAVYQTLAAGWLISRCFPAPAPLTAPTLLVPTLSAPLVSAPPSDSDSTLSASLSDSAPTFSAPTPRPPAGRPTHDGED